MCTSCGEIKKQFPEYDYCPYCGKAFRPDNVMKAAQTIHTYCFSMENCKKCPFLDTADNCLFIDSPINWDV